MAAILVVGAPVAILSQSVHGIVVDQTGLPLPGVAVQLLNDASVVASVTTAIDGTFDIPGGRDGNTVVAALDGFETARVAREDAARIVLAIAHAVETTTVVAPELSSSSPTASALGSTLTANTVARLPSSRLKARESLPLLPSMVRGADGLLRLGGARPYETPLLLDGFNITNPATGTSSVNLPFEAVHGVEVLRDPMAVTFGGLVGGVVQIVSNTGSEKVHVGVQGFIPRPRFASPGFGRLEGIFPRVYAGGATLAGRLRYFGAVEYDFERIAVPEVTTGSGPNLVEESATMFGRIDLQPANRYNVTFEALAFPSTSENLGLGPRRDESAAVALDQRDVFGGVTNRLIFRNSSVLSIDVGLLAHDTTLTPNGNGAGRLSPLGWRSNWFAAVTRHATRYSVASRWDGLVSRRSGEHAVTLSARVAAQELRGTVKENALLVEDFEGRPVRHVQFGSPSTLIAADRPVAAAARDVWTIGDRLQVDAGVRVDHDPSYGDPTPSARAGIRFAIDSAARSVLRAGYGRFVGSLPLAVASFAGYPARFDSTIDAQTGANHDTIVWQPAVGQLRLPTALATVVQFERQLRPGLDGQIGFTDRRSRRLATLDVPEVSGPLIVRSNGTGSYSELQVSIRKRWPHDQQLFVSYVQASATGELNDFAALFQPLDAPLLQPGGQSRLPADARHRWIAWGTFDFPRRIVISPVVEWHSGFPYSVVDEHYRYVGQPNSGSFPAFMAVDFIAFKTFTVRRRSADLGIQLFNATNHWNPRDVYPVAGAPRFGDFTNSVGPILRGFMLLKW